VVRSAVTKLPIIQFLQLSVTLSLFGPNIHLISLFSNNLRLCLPPNVRDEVSYPYRTTRTILFLYILIFTLSESSEKTKGPGLNGSKHYPN
jgi:hypothetical protein